MEICQSESYSQRRRDHGMQSRIFNSMGCDPEISKRAIEALTLAYHSSDV